MEIGMENVLVLTQFGVCHPLNCEPMPFIPFRFDQLVLPAILSVFIDECHDDWCVNEIMPIEMRLFRSGRIMLRSYSFTKGTDLYTFVAVYVESVKSFDQKRFMIKMRSWQARMRWSQSREQWLHVNRHEERITSRILSTSATLIPINEVPTWTGDRLFLSAHQQ